MTAARAALGTLLCMALVALAGCGGGSAAPPRPTPAPSPFAYDATRPLDARTSRAHRVGELRVRAASFAGADGQRVPALISLPAGTDGPPPCLLYVGGITSSKEQAAFLAGPLASLGIGLVAIDPRFTGERGSAQRVAAAVRDQAGIAELLRGTTLDLRRTLDYLDAEGICDPARTGYMGVSLGGLVGVLLAGSDRRVRTTVLLSIGGSLEQVLRSGSSILGGADSAQVDAAVKALAPLDPMRWIGRIAPRPVLFVNGLHDPEVPLAAADALEARAGEPKESYRHPGGHDPFAGPVKDEVLATIGAYLERTLVGPTSP